MRHDDPERLLNSAAEVPELRHALGLARGIGTHPTERARLRRALGPLLAAQAGAAVLTSVSPGAAVTPGAALTQGAALGPGAAVGVGVSGAKTALLWGLVTTTVVGAGIATAVVWPSEDPTPAPQDVQLVQAPPEHEALQEETAPQEPNEVPEVNTNKPEVAPVPHRLPQATRTAGPAPAESSASAPDPLAALERARAKLSSDPATALSLVERHRRDFPKGPLIQERELIAIEALVRTNRKTAARARADRFKQRYPSSIHQRHIEQLLDP